MDAAKLQSRMAQQQAEHDAIVQVLRENNLALQKQVEKLVEELNTTRELHALDRRRTSLKNFKEIRRKRWDAWTRRTEKEDPPATP